MSGLDSSLGDSFKFLYSLLFPLMEENLMQELFPLKTLV